MPADFQRVKEIFLAALEKPAGDERDAFLIDACRSDSALRRQIDALLLRHEEAGSFLEHPAVEDAATGQFAATSEVEQNESRSAAEGPGSRIGPYKLLQQIGEGGMGVVYMADQDAPVKRRVALKIIKPGMDSAQVIARFEAERQALALMDHPNIARVFDAGTTGAESGCPGRPYFVMELVKGVPITRFCDENHLTPRERLGLFIPVCQAVQHAHQKGIIHRDLKPSNVLVTLYDGKPAAKVIDFGVAKAMHQRLTERTMFTEFGTVLGTLEYMSPEQAELNALDIDTRSDIYSLGVLLYELLTGATPLDKERMRTAAFTEMLRLIREEEPPRPSLRLSQSGESLATISAQRKTELAKLSKLVRGELDWVVMKALEKDRNRRYETAGGLAHDIERYLHDEPVEACPPSAGYKLRKFARRHKAALATATGFLLLMVAAAAVSTWQAIRARNAETQADAERHRAEAKAAAETAIARGVNDFLQQELVGPTNIANQAVYWGGRLPIADTKVDLKALVDRAAKNMEGKFQDEPLTEAALRTTIGKVYLKLGDYAAAERNFERAVALRTPAFDSDERERLVGKGDLVLTYALEGKIDRAEALLKGVLEELTAKFGADDRETLKTKNNLAAYLMSQGKFDQAEPLYRESLAIWTAKYPADPSLALAIKHNLADLYWRQGKNARAEPLFQEVVEAARRGADVSYLLDTKNKLAIVYVNQEKYAQAEPLLREVHDAWTKNVPDAWETFNVTSLLGHALWGQRKFAEAEPLLLDGFQGLKKREAQLPGDSKHCLTEAAERLVHFYNATGKKDAAERWQKELKAAKAGAAPLLKPASTADERSQQAAARSSN